MTKTIKNYDKLEALMSYLIEEDDFGFYPNLDKVKSYNPEYRRLMYSIGTVLSLIANDDIKLTKDHSPEYWYLISKIQFSIEYLSNNSIKNKINKKYNDYDFCNIMSDKITKLSENIF